MVALTCKQGWSIFQLDLKSVFLIGPLDEEVTEEEKLINERERERDFKFSES